jgi:hypothetical protein
MGGVNEIPLIVSMGYGNEHPVFIRARNLWAVYRELFSEAQVVFVKSSFDVNQDDYLYIDGEYTFGRNQIFGHDKIPGAAPHDAQAYLVDRSIRFYKRLLADYPGPFWLYTPPVTSAIDLRVLRYIVNSMTCKGVFAGTPLHTLIPDGLAPDMPSGKVFRMISGAGTLFSSDMIRLLVERESLVNHAMLSDVWISLVLRDIPRIPMIRSDILDICSYDADVREKLKERVGKYIEEGSYLFRIKSGRWERQNELDHRPEDIDILIINDIMLHILSRPPSCDEALIAWNKYRKSICDMDGLAMLPIA